MTDDQTLSLVPAHTRDHGDGEGNFCTGGGDMQPNGRCRFGCEHEAHYANDGHPECEDRSGEPGYHGTNATHCAHGVALGERCEKCEQPRG